MKIKHTLLLGLMAVAMIFGMNGLMKGSKTDVQANAQEQTEWNLILVNKNHSIPDNYEVELQELPNGQAVDKRIYPELQEMFDAARSQGIYPEIGSSYRTTETQQAIMEEKIATFQGQGYSYEDAKKEAKKWVALPGTSEHELGLAVDINAKPNVSTDKAVYRWLADNAYRYGFILRYPSDKVAITGVDYEPWHYRYVGEKAAKKIFEADIALEEYLGEGA